jgi:outer membrane receptor protein involved in Fe transport
MILCRIGLAPLLALLLMPAASVRAAEPYAGRPVAEVLRELRASGLEFIFSSALLPDDVRVIREPTESQPVAIATEILRPHGLALTEVREKLYAVIRAPPTPAVDAGATEDLPHAVPLEQIVISTSRYAADAESSFLLEGSRMETQPGLADDPVRAIARLPGMAQSGTSAQSNVRGGDTSEVLILLDDFRIRQAFHLPGYQSLFSVLDPGLIREAEVFTGGFPVRYGDRLSGVFDLRTVSAKQEPRRSLGLSFFNANGRISDVIDGSVHADWLVAGRIGTLLPLMEAFAQDEFTPRYGDVYARGAIDTGPLRTSVNVLWASDELEVDSRKRGELAEIDSGSRYTWLRSEWNMGESLSAFVTVGESQLSSNRDGRVALPQPAEGALEDSREATFWDARAVGTWQPSDDHALEFGYEWSRQKAEYRYASSVRHPQAIASLFGTAPERTRAFTLFPRNTRAAGFVSHRWRVTPSISSELGVRTQRLEGTALPREWIYDPRLSMRWQIDDSRSLRMHWGRFHQTDEIHELLIEEDVVGFRPAQRADHFILGYEQRIGRNLTARVEAFDKHQSAPRPRFENQFDILAVLPELSVDRTRIAPDRAEFRGVEASLVYEDDPLSYWTSVVWAEAFDQFGGADVPRAWDQRWKMAAGLDWKRGRWLLSSVLDVHTGWATTFLFDPGDGAFQLGPRNEDRLPAYASLDARAEYRRPLRLGELRLALEITNFTNRENICCTQLRVEPDGTVLTQSRSWLPLLPSLSVRWDF